MRCFFRKSLLVTGLSVLVMVSLYIASRFTRHLPDPQTLGALAVYAFLLFLVNLLALSLFSLSGPKAFVLLGSVTITVLFVAFLFITDQVTIIEGAGLFLFPAMVFLGAFIVLTLAMLVKKTFFD